MGKFFNSIAQNTDGIRSERALLLSKETADQQQDLVRELQKKVRDLEHSIIKLTDIAPETNVSTLASKLDFNPQEWVRQLQKFKVDKQILEEELAIALETQKVWFSDDDIADLPNNLSTKP